MKLHTLLANIDDAEESGDITGASPAFVVVRNEGAPPDSATTWHAVSIVRAGARAAQGVVDLVADSSDDASDISVATLRRQLAELAEDCHGYEVVVHLVSPERSLDAEPGARIVDTYADENGLGLMVWFDGYEDWLASQA